MKKIASILMALIMAGALSACGGNQESAEPSTAESVATEAEPESTAESTTEEKTKEPVELELEDYGYTVSQKNGRTSISYAVKIKNPNTKYAVDYPVITATVRGADGKVLTTDDRTLMCIAADDTITYGGGLTYESDELPESVDFSVGNRDDNFVLQMLSDAIPQEYIVIENTSEIVGEYNTKYTGEITNNSDADMDVAVSVIFTKEGKLLGGTTSYVDDIGAGETKAFEISASSTVSDYDAYEIHAIQW